MHINIFPHLIGSNVKSDVLTAPEAVAKYGGLRNPHAHHNELELITNVIVRLDGSLLRARNVILNNKTESNGPH